jgi:hypothetical protein
VPYPGEAVVERDAAIVSGTYTSKPKPGVGHKKGPYNAGGAVFRGGANKYMRTAGTESTLVAAASGAGAESAVDSDAAEGGGGGSSSANTAVPAAAPVLTQEKFKVMQDFDQLKTLRQQAEEIARKKEEILLVSANSRERWRVWYEVFFIQAYTASRTPTIRHARSLAESPNGTPFVPLVDF